MIFLFQLMFMVKLTKILSELNIGFETAVEFLKKCNMLDSGENLTGNSRITDEQYNTLYAYFAKDSITKKNASIIYSKKKQSIWDNNSNPMKIYMNQLYVDGDKILIKYRHDRFVLEDDQSIKFIKKHLETNQADVRYIRINLNYENMTFSLINNVIHEDKKKQRRKQKKNQNNIIEIYFSDLFFKDKKIIISYEGKKYYFSNSSISQMFNDYRDFFNYKVLAIKINKKDHSFTFINPEFDIIFKEFKKLVNKFIFGPGNRANTSLQKNNEITSIKEAICLSVSLSQIIFTQNNSAVFNYGNSRYFCYINNSNYYYNILNSIDVLSGRKINDLEYVRSIRVSITLDNSNSLFTINNNDIHEIMSQLSQRYIIREANDTNQKICRLGINNIEFFNGYYLIYLLTGMRKDMRVSPLKIFDDNSLDCLIYIHKYLSNRFPDDIDIYYNFQEITGLSSDYKLRDYVRFLYQNRFVDGDWKPYVIDYYQKRKSHSKTKDEIQKGISLKNSYIDYLSGIKNQLKVIKCIEFRQNQKEDAFIFSIEIDINTIAIIYENASYVATASKVFIINKENYNTSIDLITNFFSNSEIKNKRQSLDKRQIPPKAFCANEYFSINHNLLKQWIKNLNAVIRRNVDTYKIQFNEGLHICKETNQRNPTLESIEVRHLHNDIITRLYKILCEEYGKENVGTENRIGNKRIDTLVKTEQGYNIYEIKTHSNPRDCIREAMGQILDYAYFEIEDMINKMYIVGPSPNTADVDQYLAKLRENHGLKLYYLTI